MKVYSHNKYQMLVLGSAKNLLQHMSLENGVQINELYEVHMQPCVCKFV